MRAGGVSWPYPQSTDRAGSQAEERNEQVLAQAE